MRNLKKILALVLALVMSMSLVSVAGAKYTVEGYSDSDKVAEEYTEAVSVLSGLGIFVGDDRGFRPEDTITRAEVATLIYRIVTGDTTKTCEGAKVYADYGKFEDCADHWAKGMINFCANQGIILGYSDTKFGPDDNITGYQAILMLLRAIGWDKNGESLNPEWRTISAGKAQLMGWTEKVNMNGLGNAATRQVVAELLFNAINTAQFTFTTLGGYDQDDNILSNNPADANANESLGYQNFDLVYSAAVSFDDWGRPYHFWFVDKNRNGAWNTTETVVAVDVYEPVVTYTEATPECDVYEDMGLVEDTDVARLYVNGESNLLFHRDLVNGEIDEFDGKINAKATKSLVGAQGRLTEIYHVATIDGNGNPFDYYTMVMIDQFLARVDDVTEVKYDKNEHIAKPATLYLTVWHDVDSSEELVLEAEENWEYEEGDYLVINAETLTYENDSEVYDRPEYDDIYEILGVADFKKSTQFAHSDKDSHYIESLEEDIPDAIRYGLDEADDNEDDSFTWFFDTYGNVLGSELIETVEDYCTIKNIWWVDSNADDADGYAKANVVMMDGSVSTIKVTHVAGKKLDSVEGTANVSYADGLVSSSRQQNTAQFAYKALYKIVGAKLVLTTELIGAQLIPGVPELTPAINANNKTMFLINEGTKGCNPYTGIKNVPSYKAVANVWYVDLNEDAHADYVFVGSVTGYGSTSTSTTTYHTFFFHSDDRVIVKSKLDNKDVEYFEISGAMIDGADAKIKIKNDAAGVGEGHVDELKAAKGQLMYITVTDGYVTEVAAVHDGGSQYVTKLGGYAVYAGLAHKSNGTYLKDGVFEDANGNSYYVDDAETFTYDGTLKSSYNHDEDAHVFFVFAKAANSDEQIVKHIYITDKAGVAAPGPKDPDALELELEALYAAQTDLETALTNAKKAEGYSAAALDLSNDYSEKYEAVEDAIIALAARFMELKWAYAAITTPTEAQTLDFNTAEAKLGVYIDTARITVTDTDGDKKVDADETLTVPAKAVVTTVLTKVATAAAKKAVAEVAAAGTDEALLKAAYENVLIARDLAGKTSNDTNVATIEGFAAAQASAETYEATVAGTTALTDLQAAAKKEFNTKYWTAKAYEDERTYVVGGDTAVTAALNKAFTEKKTAFETAIKGKTAAEIATTITTYATTIADAAWETLYDTVAQAKRTACETTIPNLMKNYSISDYNTTEWKDILAKGEKAVADVMAATTTAKITEITTKLGTDLAAVKTAAAVKADATMTAALNILAAGFTSTDDIAGITAEEATTEINAVLANAKINATVEVTKVAEHAADATEITLTVTVKVAGLTDKTGVTVVVTKAAN